MIHVEHVSKRFTDFRRGSVVALEDVSFDVKPGEIFGLLGPNGAGKTTCLRVLSTVLKPTSGVATVAGYDVLTQAAEVRARIGFMSGNTGIYDRMTAWELVEYFARLYGMEEPRLSQRLDEVFTKLQMQEFRDVLGSKMSTGMKQKVSIARTIVHNPPVLIFDEPAIGLDAEGIRWIRGLFTGLAAEGRTVLVSSHLMGEMAQTADHLIIIGRGRLLADMATQQFVAANAHHDVLVRSPRAAELTGLLTAAGAAVATEPGGGLAVTGLDAPAIADLAAARGLPVHELTARQASLEEAYLDLTEASTEYRSPPAGSPPEGGPR